ncbi:hypothetical protein ACO2I3_01115 [Leptospira interrogans]
MGDENELPDEGVRRHRNPTFPFISLSKAVERARQLHGKARQQSVSMSVLADAWDYGEKSSGLTQTAAALIQYGFLDDVGSGDRRRFSLTNDAARIVMDQDPQSEKVRRALRRAALAPKMFTELWARYRNAKGIADVAIEGYLTLDRSDVGLAVFSRISARELISVYRATLATAGLDGDDVSVDDSAEFAPTGRSDANFIAENDDPPQQKPPEKGTSEEGAKASGPSPGERMLQAGMLSADATYRILVTGKVGKEEIDRLIRKLEIDKEFLAED